MIQEDLPKFAMPEEIVGEKWFWFRGYLLMMKKYGS